MNIDRRRFSLSDILKADYIPLFGGRPGRESAISHEDILNLRIDLGRVYYVEEMIGLMYDKNGRL